MSEQALERASLRPIMQVDYAPRRQRADRARAEIIPPTAQAEISPIEPLSDAIVQDVARTTTLFHNTIKERNDFADRLNEANARIEQFQGRLADIQSQLETARLEVQEANRRTDDQRAIAVRLMSILENIGGLVADGVQQ